MFGGHSFFVRKSQANSWSMVYFVMKSDRILYIERDGGFIMQNMDSIKLLQECDAGVKMGIESIDEVMDKVSSSDLKALLKESREHHEKIENEICELLRKYKAGGKDPNPVAKGMSWMKTTIKVGMDNRDSVIADLITDGANMGVKSLNEYLNQYKDAEPEVQKICRKMIDIEDKLEKELRKFLRKN